jgi:hypothetical protein
MAFVKISDMATAKRKQNQQATKDANQAPAPKPSSTRIESAHAKLLHTREGTKEEERAFREMLDAIEGK